MTTKTSIEPTVTHHTFVIERSYPVSPERVFAALADPAKKRKWYAESDHHDTEAYEMDFRAGGREHARYRYREGSPIQGAVITNDGIFQDIVPNRRIVCASTMSMGGRPFSASLTTFELIPTEQGTELIFTHQGAFFEGSDGPKGREGGWQKLLDRLAGELAGK
jgi:uncharacterized protein YndB with AHSA1/START domain